MKRKSVYFLILLVLLTYGLLFLLAMLSCKKDSGLKLHNCGTVWDKGRNANGDWELFVDDRTIKVDSATWNSSVIPSTFYCK